MTDFVTLKIPIIRSIYDATENALISTNNKINAETFVTSLLSDICTNTLMTTTRTKEIPVVLFRDGQRQQEVIPLQNEPLKEIESDPTWLPNKSESDELTYFTVELSSVRLDLLKKYTSLEYLRHFKFAESVKSFQLTKIQKMRDTKSDQESIQKEENNLQKIYDELLKKAPSCIEEALSSHITEQSLKLIQNSIEQELKSEHLKVVSAKKK